MISRVIFGDRLDFEQKNGFTQMFLNGEFVCDLQTTGNVEMDIGILMNYGYCE